jgi:signal transduction histidine kinase/CheY-like chemotaxis protein
MLQPAAGFSSSRRLLAIERPAPVPGKPAADPDTVPVDPDTEQVERLKRLQFESLTRHAARLPILIPLVAALVGFIAWDSAPRALIVCWVLALVVVLTVRWRYSTRALKRSDLDIDAALRTMVALSACNGLIQGGGIALFFPGLSLQEKATVTMIMVCLSAGAVSANAGFSRSFYAWAIPMFGTLGLAWALQADVMGTWIALLLMLFPVAEAVFVRDNERVLRESFAIRYQNEQLIRELELQRQAVARERDRAEEANRAKSRFLAAASHDLRQPLHTLSLYSASLMDKTDEDTADIAADMGAAIAALGSLLDALLDISKLDAGAVRPEPQLFSLGALVTRIGAEFRPLAAAKGLELGVQAAQPTHVFTDAVLLEQVIRNLLDNAVKYTGQGSIRVLLRQERGRALLTIADTGPGIPHEEHERVFEEFYQLRNRERDRSRGIGLGLAIVKRLASLLRIELSLESEEGRGASFSLAVPLADKAQVNGAGRARKPKSEAVPLPSGLSVLVVDDDGSVRKSMRALLKRWDCAVTLASGTAEALQALAGERFDLIIADQRLRGTETGIELVRRARAQAGEIPALLITGDTAAEISAQAEELGLTVLHKPVSEAKLRSAIAGAVSGEVR